MGRVGILKTSKQGLFYMTAFINTNKNLTAYEICHAVKMEMERYGIITTYDPMDFDQVKRFKIQGQRNKNGWVIISMVGRWAFAAFGDWSTGVTGKWSERSENTLSAEEYQEYKKAFSEQQKKRREAEQKYKEEKTKEAQAIYENLKPLKKHAYTDKKQISVDGMRHIERIDLISAEGKEYTLKDQIAIAYTDVNGNFKTMQMIGADGGKLFYSGAEKRGTMVLMGENTSDKILLGEGVSTVKSVYDLIGGFCVASGDCGNLLPVAQELRKRYPSKEIVILADNDQYKPPKNAGIEAAKKVCEEIKNCRYVFPDFEDKTNKPTDFNDLMIECGVDVLAEKLYDDGLAPKEEKTQITSKEIDPAIFVTPLPDMTIGSKPKPRNTIENFKEIIRRLKIDIQYNSIKKEEEIKIPFERFNMDNRSNASLARIISRCAQFDFPTSNVSEFITYIAAENEYNPVKDWISASKWDGVDRLSGFLKTITPREVITLPNGELLHEVFIKRWMTQAVASAYSENGLAGSGVLVLQGDQNLGKTTWLKRLVGEKTEFFKDGVVLRLDRKDEIKQAVSYWIVELGELDGTFNKSEASALKAFLTNDSDEMRQAYARKTNKFPRRTVFCASVNPEQFLKDPTGNRRYWTIPCLKIESLHEFDMQQVWAQIYHEWKKGYDHYLSKDEYDAMMGSNENFAESNPIAEIIQTKLDWSADIRDWRWFTATEILLQLGVQKPNNAEVKMASATIKKLNEGQSRRNKGKNQIFVPPCINAMDRPFI